MPGWGLRARERSASRAGERTRRCWSWCGRWSTARPGQFAYGVSKSALSGLTRSLALALAPNIQVNEIALGAILPPANIGVDRPREQIKINLGPADRMGKLNEVADAVLMLIQNDFITGETINVDGGKHIY